MPSSLKQKTTIKCELNSEIKLYYAVFLFHFFCLFCLLNARKKLVRLFSTSCDSSTENINQTTNRLSQSVKPSTTDKTARKFKVEKIEICKFVKSLKSRNLKEFGKVLNLCQVKLLVKQRKLKKIKFEIRNLIKKEHLKQLHLQFFKAIFEN